MKTDEKAGLMCTIFRVPFLVLFIDLQTAVSTIPEIDNSRITAHEYSRALLKNNTGTDMFEQVPEQ